MGAKDRSGSRRVGGNPGATREPGSWRTGIRGGCGRRSGIGGRRDQGATDGGINNTKDARPQLMPPDPPAGCGLPTARRGDTGPPPRTEGHGAAPGHGTGGRPRTGGHGVHATRAGRARRRPTRTAPHGSYMSSAHHMSCTHHVAPNRRWLKPKRATHAEASVELWLRSRAPPRSAMS